MVKELTGGYKVKYHVNGLDNDPIEIDFTPPFRCLDFVVHIMLDCPVNLKMLEKLKYFLTCAEGLI